MSNNVTRQKALTMLSDYYQANKQWLPPSITNYREQIIQFIIDGCCVEDAIKRCIN